MRNNSSIAVRGASEKLAHGGNPAISARNGTAFYRKLISGTQSWRIARQSHARDRIGKQNGTRLAHRPGRRS